MTDRDPAPTAGEDTARPPLWSADVLASDGGVVRLRPIEPGDADALVRFHGSLSDRTRYLRYFGPYPTMPQRDVEHFTRVDHTSRVAFVATLGDDIIAVGRYERLPDPADSAEVAFVVADAHQGRGLGPILLEHLAAAAARNGIARFVADVLAENRNMVTVFREAGYQVTRTYDGGTLSLQFDIDPTEALVTVRNSRERATEARSVRNVLAPRSVAVIGASADPAKVGNAVLTNLLRGSFTGPVYPVNAEQRSVRGVRAYRAVSEIPDDVDLAIAAVPADAIEAVLDDCLAKGVTSMVVVSSGFGETGDQGRATERRLVHAARAHGMRLVGPNALGVANLDPAVSLNATLAPVLPHRGRVGFFCQSGALGIAILEQASVRRLGLSTFVSAGNRADVSGNDLLQYWDSDEQTDVVMLYLESFGNSRKFWRIARRLSRTKPIVAVKSGRGAVPPALQTGQDIDDTIVRALFEQAGVIQVDSISDLFDCGVLLGYQPLPGGPRVAVVGNSTALGTLAVDAARSAGLVAGVPVDVGPGASPEAFASAVARALGDEDVDAVVAVFVPPVAVSVGVYARALRAAVVGSEKPVVTTFLAAEGIPEVLAVYDADGLEIRGSVPSYPDPGRAVGALARAWRYSAWLARPVEPATRPQGIDVDRARALVEGWHAQAPEGRWLTDEECAELMTCYSLPFAEFLSVSSEEEAVTAARTLGHPVAVKATAQHWRHRPDLDGVRLDLVGDDAVARAYRDLSEASQEKVVVVQRMAAKGIGCSIRVLDDQSFGSLISFGLSGLLSDLLADRAYRVLPITRRDARELLTAPRAAPLLAGYGGLDPVDQDALIDVIERVAALVGDLPEVLEMRCDPVLASPSGAAITDARIRTGSEPTSVDLGPRRLR